MSAGDIHNHNGSICKATKKPCPFGDKGHSKDVDSFVEYQARENGVDEEQLRSLIADGVPLSDSIEIVKSGLTATGEPLRKTGDAYGDMINADTFGYMQELSGAEFEKEVENADKNLARGYTEGFDETIYGDESVDDLNHSYRRTLAYYNGVSPDDVKPAADGSMTFTRKDGKTVSYDAKFRRKTV